MKKIYELNIETIMTKIRNAIYNNHLLWEEVAEMFGTSVNNLRYNYVKPYYKVKHGSYKLLCEQEKQNRRNREAANAVIATDNQPAPSNEVLVVETGSVIDLGLEGILEYGMDTYISDFCLRELSRMSESANAEDFLARYKEAGITSINMRNREALYVDPEDEVKNRSKGVVALAVYMDANGYKVKLVTNSREIENLANLQGAEDIEVVRLRHIW